MAEDGVARQQMRTCRRMCRPRLHPRRKDVVEDGIARHQKGSLSSACPTHSIASARNHVRYEVNLLATLRRCAQLLIQSGPISPTWRYTSTEGRCQSQSYGA